MFDSVRADFDRLAEHEPGLPAKIGLLFFHPGLQAVLAYRLARWLRVHHLGPFAVVTSYLGAVLTGAQISPRAAIGSGMRIEHPYGIVIGAGTVIGERCTLSHGNLIGTFAADEERPVIGRNLAAATGAKILGKITIGDNVSVGPNAVVITSLPSDVVAVGNPASVLLRAGPAATPSAAPSSASAGADIVGRLVALLRRSVDVVTVPESMDEATGLLGEGIGLDSVEILKLVCAIEEEFGLTIDESELTAARFKTVGSLAAFVREKSAS